MPKAVQLNSLVAEAIDPTTVGASPVFDVAFTKAGDATHRPQFEGALDPAETVRVRAYIPDENTDESIVMSISDLRPGKEGVKLSRDGKVNVSHFEDKTRNLLVLLWSPVNLSPLEKLTVVRS